LEPENVILFDMDGTICNFEQPLRASMMSLESAGEKHFDDFSRDKYPDYIKARRDLILSRASWWASLPKFELGMDIWEWAIANDYQTMILTQGSKRNPKSWMGKKMWIDKNLGTDVDVTITRDKGLVYGKVFVDDYPIYIERWLRWRPRSLVIMPAHKYNEGFVHPQVIRYDGNNFGEVSRSIKSIMKGEST